MDSVLMRRDAGMVWARIRSRVRDRARIPPETKGVLQIKGLKDSDKHAPSTLQNAYGM